MTRYWYLAVVAALIAGGWAYSISRSTPSQTNESKLPDRTLNSADGDQKLPAASTVDSEGLFVAAGVKIAKNYYQYSKADYQAASSAKRPIFLYFYANWCPTCAEQEPRVVAMMNGISDGLDQVVAFRVNFNDSDTDSEEKKLAEEFGVRYQHTMFVINRSGQTVKKFLGRAENSDILNAFKQAN